MNRLQKPAVVCLLAMLSCFLWGSAFPMIKIGYKIFEIAAEDPASQIYFAGLRFFLAGIFTVLISSLYAKKFVRPEDRTAFGHAGVLSLFQTIGQYVFFYIGLAHMTGVKSSIYEAFSVFIAILIASLLFRQEHLTVRKIIGCFIGFSGVVLINLGGVNFEFALNGEGFLLLSSVCYAISSCLTRIYAQRDDPVMLSGWQFVIGGAVLAAAGRGLGGSIHVPNAGALLILFYLAALSAVAFSVWGILIKYNPVSRVSIYSFMTPVFGVLLSFLLLKEKPASGIWISLLALALVCLGIYTVSSEGKGKKHEQERTGAQNG